MFNKKIEDDSEHSFWISYADMLTGFLISFMVIALILAAKKECPPPCPDKFGTQKPLFKEFEDEMKGCEAVTIADKATLRFNAAGNGVLFEPESDEPTPYFKSVLEKFSPTFNRVMYELVMKRNYNVDEIRFEGHTDSERMTKLKPKRLGAKAYYSEPMTDSLNAYFDNLKLASRRASNVQAILIRGANEYGSFKNDGKSYFKDYEPDNLTTFRDILLKNSMSCGYSYSKHLNKEGAIIPMDDKNSEDRAKSRRIEIRIIGSDKN